MTFIDGFGDEVTEFFLVITVIAIGLIAWWSTGINHRPLIRTVLIFEHRARNRILSNTSTTSPPPVSSDSVNVTSGPTNDTAGTSTSETEPIADDASRAATESSLSEQIEQNAIVETMDADTCTVRKRRLVFFQNNLATNVVKENTTDGTGEPHTSSEDNAENENIVNEQMYSTDAVIDRRSAATEPIATHEKNGELIRIKLKYLNDDIKAVEGKLCEKLGDFKRRHFEVEMTARKLVRLIFNGQVLQKDSETLQGCGLFDNCVVHCLVHQQQSHGGTDTNDTSEGNRASGSSSSPSYRAQGTSQRTVSSLHWDLGNILFGLVTFILSSAWYFRYEYAQLFTVTATVFLVCLTGIFTLLLIGLLYPDPPGDPAHATAPTS